jgi:Glyoxalase-like domain
MATGIQVAFDAADPDKIARFWADALGYILQPPPEGYESWDQFLVERGMPGAEWENGSAIVDPDGTRPRIYFQRVPEPKTMKNRLHLDIAPGGRRGPVERRRATVDAEVDRLIGAGATRLYHMVEYGQYHVTMADPEGNEFCVH